LIPAVCVLLAASTLFAGPGLYEIREVKPHVFVWVPDDVLDQETDPLFNRTGTSAFLVTEEGVVVVDTTNSPFHAREVLYEIRRRTEEPVRYVINTSSGGDYFLGNEVFADQRATLICTLRAQAEMRQYRAELAQRMGGSEGWRLQARLRGFHVTPGNQTFGTEVTLRVGGQEIKLSTPLGNGDAIAYLPATKVVFLGDLYRNGYFPRIGSRDVRRWIETLRQIETWDADTYVPGHGPPGGKKELAEFRGFLEWLVGQIETRVKEGKSFDEIKKELVLPATFHWHAPDLAPSAVEAVYEQFTTQQPVPPKQQALHQ
jgi:glyoxylase-like metal-dependent hydrolase (beta-lactamase superfamily II)